MNKIYLSVGLGNRIYIKWGKAVTTEDVLTLSDAWDKTSFSKYNSVTS